LVHSSLITANSKALHAMFEGNWAECHSREVDWSEWEESTVKCYLEWTYTGSYSVSECSGDKTPPAEVESQPTPKPTVQKPQLDIHQPLLHLLDCFAPQPTPRPDDTPFDMGDFSTISMAHVKLYTLAQYTNTAALEEAVLGRLHMILSQTTAVKDSKTAESVVHLVEYVYANTNSLVNSEEPMRRVISTFCAAKMFELLGNPTFQKLISEGGDFVVDVWEKAKRLIESERKESEERGKANTKLEIKCASLSRENQLMEYRCESLRNEKGRWEAKCTSLCKEKKDMGLKCTSLGVEKTALTKEVADLRKRIRR